MSEALDTIHEARLDAGWLGADDQWPTFAPAGVPTHCDRPMRYRGCSNRWEGPPAAGTAAQTVSWDCGCGARIEMTLRMPA